MGRVEEGGLGSPLTLGLIAGGVALLGAFLLVERVVRSPLALVANPSVSSANLVSLAANGAAGAYVLVSLHLQLVLGLSTLAPASCWCRWRCRWPWEPGWCGPASWPASARGRGRRLDRLAVMVAIATSVAGDAPSPDATADGYRWAIVAAAAIGATGAVLSGLTPRAGDARPPVTAAPVPCPEPS